MQIFHSLEEITRHPRPSAVTIGSFDGIHRAHKELLRRVRDRARQRGVLSVAVTFDPHPAIILAPARAPKLLTPLPVKLELLERSGIDLLLVLPFTEEFSRWPAAQFVQQVLVDALHAESVFVGENFRFGHRQEGDPQVLQRLGTQFGFRTEILDKMFWRGSVVSSSRIRALLEEGKITLANRLLGHPFYMRGMIEPGLGIGSTRTVPTLNLDASAVLVPQRGVYITLARLGEVSSLESPAREPSQPIPAVSNVGTRPTFGDRAFGVETHLLEMPLEAVAGEKPGNAPASLDVSFLYRLREERKFDSAEQLKAQILRDVRRAQRYFDRLRRARIQPS